MLTGLIFCLSSFVAGPWPGLDIATFRNDEEKQRSQGLLDMFEKHINIYPGKPGPTSLFFLLKGDEESLIRANEMIIQGNVRDAFPILHGFPDKISQESSEILKKWIRDHLQEGSWHWTRSTKLYNINWPLQACEVLILGGEMMGDLDAASHGYNKLREVLDGIVKLPIGTVSEFNSPTYYGVDIGPLAHIAHYSTNEGCRIKAMLLEERLWLDLATRYNPNMGQLAGPFSRVYHDGLVGATSIARSQMYKVFDESIYTQFDMAMHYPHYWDLAFAPSIAFQTYHCPDYIRHLALGKVLPYEVRGTSAGDRFGSYPFSFTDLHTYVTKDWTLGSNSRNWLDGNQNAACVAYWRRKQTKVRSMKDFKVLVSRYQINDSGPDAASLEQPEMGRICSLQDKGTIIAAYKPKKKADPHHKVKGIEEIIGSKVYNLRLDIQIPLYEDMDELYVGYRPVDPHSPMIETVWDNRVYIRDGDVFIGIRPLEPTEFGIRRPLRIRRFNGFLIISIFNLDSSSPRELSDEELDHCKNGFIMEISSASEYPDLNQFRNHFENGKANGELDGDIRTIDYKTDSQTMMMKYNMVTEEFIERTVNDKSVEYPLFSCPNAAISVDGQIIIGDSRLETNPGIYALLIADPEKEIYAAYNFADELVPMKLQTPAGVVRADRIGFSKIVFRTQDSPILEIWAVEREGAIAFPVLPDMKVVYNGEDMTAKLTVEKVENVGILELE